MVTITLLAPALAASLVTVQMARAQTLLDVHKDAGVPCSACHAEEPPAIAPANDNCVACHGTKLESEDTDGASRPDPHLSLQLEPGEIPPCTTCHTVHGSKD